MQILSDNLKISPYKEMTNQWTSCQSCDQGHMCIFIFYFKSIFLLLTDFINNCNINTFPRYVENGLWDRNVENEDKKEVLEFEVCTHIGQF